MGHAATIEEGVGVAAGDVVWDGVNVGLGEAPNDKDADDDGALDGVAVTDVTTSSAATWAGDSATL